MGDVEETLLRISNLRGIEGYCIVDGEVGIIWRSPAELMLTVANCDNISPLAVSGARRVFAAGDDAQALQVAAARICDDVRKGAVDAGAPGSARRARSESKGKRARKRALRSGPVDDRCLLRLASFFFFFFLVALGERRLCEPPRGGAARLRRSRRGAKPAASAVISPLHSLNRRTSRYFGYVAWIARLSLRLGRTTASSSSSFSAGRRRRNRASPRAAASPRPLPSPPRPAAAASSIDRLFRDCHGFRPQRFVLARLTRKAPLHAEFGSAERGQRRRLQSFFASCLHSLSSLRSSLPVFILRVLRRPQSSQPLSPLGDREVCVPARQRRRIAAAITRSQETPTLAETIIGLASSSALSAAAVRRRKPPLASVLAFASI